jgi:hypothetical protein
MANLFTGSLRMQTRPPLPKPKQAVELVDNFHNHCLLMKPADCVAGLTSAIQQLAAERDSVMRALPAADDQNTHEGPSCQARIHCPKNGAAPPPSAAAAPATAAAAASAQAPPAPAPAPAQDLDVVLQKALFLRVVLVLRFGTKQPAPKHCAICLRRYSTVNCSHIVPNGVLTLLALGRQLLHLGPAGTATKMDDVKLDLLCCECEGGFNHHDRRLKSLIGQLYPDARKTLHQTLDNAFSQLLDADMEKVAENANYVGAAASNVEQLRRRVVRHLLRGTNKCVSNHHVYTTDHIAALVRGGMSLSASQSDYHAWLSLILRASVCPLPQHELDQPGRADKQMGDVADFASWLSCEAGARFLAGIRAMSIELKLGSFAGWFGVAARARRALA